MTVPGGPHSTSNPSGYFVSSSTAPATPSELSKDREVIVKLRNAGVVRTYRRLTTLDIKQRAETAKQKICVQTGTLSLAKARFVAARQLRSGYLSLSLRYAAEAEAARTHDQWANHLSAGAMLRHPSWGIVVHGIVLKSIGDLTTETEQQRVASELLGENRDCWVSKEAPQISRITRIAWLTYSSNHKNQKSSALIVEFLDPRYANEAIARGTIWDSELSVRIKQLAGSVGEATRPGTAPTSLPTARSAAVQGVEKHTLPGTKGVRASELSEDRIGFAADGVGTPPQPNREKAGQQSEPEMPAPVTPMGPGGAWGKGQKISMLLLDVAGAFDNVSHIRLLHNLHMIGLGFFAGWLKSFLSNRSTRLQLPGYLSNLILIPTRILQGSPISPIAHLDYHSDAHYEDRIKALPLQDQNQTGRFRPVRL
ncbi:putative RNA-directed DNA polymerase from transposon X-element [Aspergillus affinis]|uniref:putative RNA-directed DNA polymerase from transposon X-element n=1 Tax=Aspergillus affinis TaxID=1070780 RepID=UPI0022FDFA30|nr:putative RNA-directed DNA polymerase from transposon X-element [Aspergillus affinis]KAI9035641.1 putative RNA-directed DNA polymerase from transposon X-element [Aspergillus affinis]